MTAREQEAQALRISAARLLDLADQLERPRTADTTHANSCTCDRCGDQVRGLRWIGDRCEAHVRVAGCLGRCAGTYRLDQEPANHYVATCNECITRATQAVYDATRGVCPICGDRLLKTDLIPGSSDEVLRTTDGRSLGVTRDQLAASQAALDEAAEHWMGLDLSELSDRSDDDGLDIATTYRGRAS